jgi:hypothetical protein
VFICEAFPEQTYPTYEEAFLETLIEHGMSFVNGDDGFITEAEEVE